MVHTPYRDCPSLRFVGSSCTRQHPLKTKMGAIFADACELTPTMLGICDGVSEVQNYGIDPALLPEELLFRCKELIEAAELSEESAEPQYQTNQVGSNDQWLRDLLEQAYFQTSAQGSTTILLAAIENGKQLVTLNVGDSGLLLLRPNAGNYHVIFRTEPLRYDQFRPYQVGRLKGVSSSQIRSIIRQSSVERVVIQPGDMLVLGSDGLFDNLFEEDMVKAVSSYCNPDGFPDDPSVGSPSVKQLKQCANALVQSALQAVSIGQIGPNGDVEFSSAAKVAPSGHGGKADDTSCIVVTVVNWNESFQSVPVENPRWLQRLFCVPKCNEDTMKTRVQSDCRIL